MSRRIIKKQNRNNLANRKLSVVFLVVIFLASIVILNVSYTVVTGKHLNSGADIVELKKGTDEVVAPIVAKRGYIYDRNGNIIAQDIDTFNIIFYLDKSREYLGDPAYVVDKKDTAKKIAPIIGMDENELYNALNKNNLYQTEIGSKGRNLSSKIKDEIEKLDLSGVEFTKNTNRVYPYSKFASHLIGFAQYEEKTNDNKLKESTIVGKMGLEKYLNDTLTGTNGLKSYKVDVSNNKLPGSEQIISSATNGNDVYLTLDKDIQLSLENMLNKAMSNEEINKAWGVVMEVKTGKILGYASYPTFDLNKKEIENYVDYPSQYAFECGSVMKPFVYATAMDLDKYKGEDKFQSGSYYLAARSDGTFYRLATPIGSTATVSDALGKNWGYISFDEGLIRSANTGILTLLESYITPKDLETYMDKFGFFKTVNVDGISEERNGKKVYNYAIEKATTAFGQGSTVNTLQLMQAYTAIFNDGKMVKPYIIDKVVDSSTSEIISKGKTEVVGNPISKETSDEICDLMEKVASDPRGTAHGYQLKNGIKIISKTGTGEIAGPNGYYRDRYTSSVIAAAPYEDPEIMIFYAFENKDIINYNRTYFRDALTEMCSIMNITNFDHNIAQKDPNYEKYEEYSMPSLINHSMEFANSKIANMNVNKVIIGDGTHVINQYPASTTRIGSKSNMFILTDGKNIKMPNMIGWSRKDILLFSNLSGIDVSIKGSGVVAKQSVNVNSSINESSKIKVELE